MTASERISTGLYFGHRIVQVGNQPASEAESQLLLEALNVAAASNYELGLAELEEFLSILTNSPWAPGLDAALGKHYYDKGRYSLALEHYELAWEATKDYESGNGKKIADFALAHWSRLLASLGRYEAGTLLLHENRTRVLDRGPLSQMWARTREAFADMRKRPGVSYQCGAFALKAVAKELKLDYDARTLANTPSPTTGFSMATLAELSTRLGLGLIPVTRVAGGELPVPSVVHWRQDHYAAIVARRGELYQVVDPTFGHPRFMTAETINAEASGHFLVVANQVPVNYRSLGMEEASLIYGRGNPNFLRDGDDQTCETCPCPLGSNGPNGGDGPGGPFGGNKGFAAASSDCGSCSGMPVWRVSEPYINLWLEDEPLGYQPALGDRVSFSLSYKQRDEYPGYFYEPNSSSVGLSWNCPWLSSVSTYYDSPIISYGKGGTGYYLSGYASPETPHGNYYNNLKMASTTNELGAYVYHTLYYPSGAKDVYGFNPTNYYGWGLRSYLTQKISSDGRTVNFFYEDYDPDVLNIRLKYVVDADGKTNTIYYATSGFSTNLITQVTDPYGRSTYLQYDEYGLLTNITDTANMSSSIGYNELGWPTNLTTPYGVTTFESIDEGYLYHEGIDRSIVVTEPNNSKQIYAFIWVPPYEATSYGSAEVPTNTPIDTLDNYVAIRNSYHWNRLQSAALSTADVYSLTASDFLKGRMRHWLGANSGTFHHEKSVDTLSVQREPSPDGVIEGQKTWYDYPDKDYYGNATHVLPGVIARVLPDGSTWYQWSRRNEWGSPTNTVETYTKPDGNIGLRTNVFTYAANGLDLVLHIGPEGEQVVSNYFGNSYHQVDASYDALNQETLYAYNGYRQLSSIARPGGLHTTNIYFASGDAENRLEKTIDLEITRTNSYTYAGDLVFSHTDERGLTVTNYWDGLQRLVGRKYPDGTTTSNIYTALDITASKDRLGHWAYVAYNGIRQKTSETNANGVVTGYGLCDCGAILSVTNAWNTTAQMVTSFGYDFQGNRLYTYHPDATETNWFDALGRTIVTGDGWGYRWFFYNNQGLLTVVSNVYGPESITLYDIDDHPLYVTDANGVTITNSYDELHRLSTRTYPDGGVERFGYSARGLVAYTNQLDFVTRYAYDEARRKTYETNANTEIIRYTNNAAGDLLSLTDGKNQTTRWKYDEYGRVTNKLDQASAEILRYAYDPNSRLTNRWSAAMGNTKYSYDAVGNLTLVDYFGSPDVTLQYDPLNRVTNMVDAVGTTKYAYAAGGQLWTEDNPWSSDTVTNIYDNRMRTGLRLQQPTGVWTNAFGYDAAKRLTSVASRAGTFSYTLAATAPGSAQIKKLLLPNTSYITNTYDGNARLLSTRLNNSSHTTLDAALYDYNAGNQRLAFTNAAGTYARYDYDPIGQLKVVRTTNSSGTIISGETKGYAYDAAWNLNQRTNNSSGATTAFTVDSKNQLTGGPDPGYLYDGNGNLTRTGSSTYDYTYYTYDAENRLISRLHDRDGAYSPPLRTDFVYDGLGRLRVRTEYYYDYGVGNWWTIGHTRYLYDGMRVIQERDGSNVPQVSYTRGTDLSGSLEGAGGIGGLLARSHTYISGNWFTHNFYHADGNGNITYLVNSSQTLAASYRYDPYGNTISSSGTLASANVYRFSSKEIHASSGLYYYGYRWYAPNLQRWLNRDPIGEPGFEAIDSPRSARFSGEPKGDFLFVDNGPVNFTDAFGLFRFDKKCKPTDVARMQKEFKDTCAKATQGNCFRCLNQKGQAGVTQACNDAMNNAGPKVSCEDNSKWCNSGKGCGWTGALGGIHICMNLINNLNINCSETGCTLLHEAGHSVGGVKDDTNMNGDNRSYAIAKCSGCTVDPARQLPPGY